MYESTHDTLDILSDQETCADLRQSARTSLRVRRTAPGRSALRSAAARDRGDREADDQYAVAAPGRLHHPRDRSPGAQYDTHSITGHCDLICPTRTSVNGHCRLTRVTAASCARFTGEHALLGPFWGLVRGVLGGKAKNCD
jgi:hypothetical protein